MNQLIIDAVNGRKCLELRYHGYSRIVEPHAYGRDKDGDEVLRCYQTSGGSVSGERAGWKLLKVREIFSLHLLKEVILVRKEYKKGDKAMERIFAQL
jgi:hypothetical protein